MKNFIKNWDYKKHIAAETMFYTSVALIGNAFFSKPTDKSNKSDCPVAYYKSMPKRQKCFNHIVLGCFVADMVAGYFALKGLKRIVK